MTDDLDAIRARWASVAWRMETEREDGLATNVVFYDHLDRVVLDVDRPGDIEVAVLEKAAAAPADIQTLLAALKAQTAQRAWTEIGARSEARLVALRRAVLLIIPDLDAWGDSRIDAIAEHLEVAAARADDATPLLDAAQKIVAAWDRLCDCVAEFEDYDLEAMACGELKQYLDDAIAMLKGLVEGERAATAPAVQRASIDSAGERNEDGTQQKGASDAELPSDN